MRLLRSLAFLVLAVPLGAQQLRATRDASVRAVPDGNVIATVEAGTTWPSGAARGGYTRISLEGWVDNGGIAGRRDTFPNSIGGTGTLRLRAEPSLSGRILGVFESGAGVRVLERRGTWARVRRDAWILTAATASAASAAVPPAATTRDRAPAPAATRPTAAATRAEAQPPGASSSDADGASAPREGALRALRGVPLSAAPGTRSVGALDSAAVVEPLARDRGWVRVRVEAWVPESLLVPAEPEFARALTAADLRLDPDGLRGRTVRWVVQVISLQAADPLRRALQPDEPYLLAMGPQGENAILYLAVPPALLDDARRIAPLTEVIVTARVRTGRSQPTGAPVLDLLSLTRR